MLENRELIQKADLQLATLVSNGGNMLAGQVEQFILLAIDKAQALPLLARVDMTAQKERRETLRFGSRVGRKGAELTALPSAQRVTPDTTYVELDAKEVVAEARLSRDSMRGSIEKGKFADTVKRALAAAWSRDVEDLCFNGDTTSADDLLKTFDGYRKRATTNLVAGGSGSLTRSLLKRTMKTMPSPFRGNRRELRYFTADECEIDYHESLGDRATQLGDRHVENEGDTTPALGAQVIGVPSFPITTNETDMLLGNPGNFLFGVWDELTIEMESDISARSTIIVMSSFVDARFAYEPAIVKTTAILAS